MEERQGKRCVAVGHPESCSGSVGVCCCVCSFCHPGQVSWELL